MTRPYDENFDSKKCAAEPQRVAAPRSRSVQAASPLRQCGPIRDGDHASRDARPKRRLSGCRPFIAATAKLPPDVRRRLLVNASGALLDFCDHHGAAECLKHALGLEHEAPSDELDQVIDDGLQAIAEAADQDSDEEEDDDDEEDAWSTEDLIRLIDEVHQTPSS